MFQFTKRVAAIILKFACLALVFASLTYLDSPVAAFFDDLKHILFGALLLIGLYFNKQKAVLLICLFLAITMPLDFLAAVYFDDVIVTNGIVVLLAMNTLLLGLF